MWSAGSSRWLTHGIPLEIVLDRLDQGGMICDWGDFWGCSMKQGWLPDRTFLKLKMAIGDVYGPEFRVQWEERMQLLIKQEGG